MNPLELIEEYRDLVHDLASLRKGMPSKYGNNPNQFEKRIAQLKSLIRNIGWKGMLTFDIPSKNAENSRWINEGVNVYRGPSLGKEVTDLAIAGFKDMISEVGLDFRIQDAGVFYRTEDVGENNNILLYDRHLQGIVWGWSEFGKMQIPIPHLPNRGYLRKVVKHETGHFLGFGNHHDTNPNSQLGYSEPGKCVMLYEIPTPDLCDKCRDALIFMWMFKEHRDGRRYFRTPRQASYLLH